MNEPSHRTWGTSGPTVILVHGGPAAPGSLSPLARELAGEFRIIEAFQRGSSPDRPLTVEEHIADLYDLAVSIPRTNDQPPALVGHSWGAMLALACAAEHGDKLGKLILIGCGTFDTAAREEFRKRLAERQTIQWQQQLAEVDRAPNLSDSQRFERQIQLIDQLYAFDLLDRADDAEHNVDHGQLIGPFDKTAHEQSWQDMLRLQAEGVYPAAFASIANPVDMVHGDYDPHPGPLIRDGLLPFIPHLRYHQIAACGHDPWKERQARRPFFNLLRQLLQTDSAPA